MVYVVYASVQFCKLCILVVMYSYCYVYVFWQLCMFRSVYCFIVLFCVLSVCKRVLYYCHRKSTQLQIPNIYHIITIHACCSNRVDLFSVQPEPVEKESSLRITIRRTRKKEEGIPKSSKNKGHDQGSGNRRIPWAGKIPKFILRDGGKQRKASVRAVDHRPEIGISELLTWSEISFSSANGWSRSIPRCFVSLPATTQGSSATVTSTNTDT